MKESFEHNKCEMNTALCLFALYEYNIQNYIKNQIKSNHQVDEFAHQIYFLFFFQLLSTLVIRVFIVNGKHYKFCT